MSALSSTTCSGFQLVGQVENAFFGRKYNRQPPILVSTSLAE